VDNPWLGAWAGAELVLVVAFIRSVAWDNLRLHRR
jgi:hypothetical protein